MDAKFVIHIKGGTYTEGARVRSPNVNIFTQEEARENYIMGSSIDFTPHQILLK
jgi:hypothetical protein